MTVENLPGDMKMFQAVKLLNLSLSTLHILELQYKSKVSGQL